MALTHCSGCFHFCRHPSSLLFSSLIPVLILSLPSLSPISGRFLCCSYLSSFHFNSFFLLILLCVCVCVCACVFRHRQHLHRHADRLKKRPNKSLFPANRAIFRKRISFEHYYWMANIWFVPFVCSFGFKTDVSANPKHTNKDYFHCIVHIFKEKGIIVL